MDTEIEFRFIQMFVNMISMFLLNITLFSYIFFRDSNRYRVENVRFYLYVSACLHTVYSVHAIKLIWNQPINRLTNDLISMFLFFFLNQEMNWRNELSFSF